MKLYALHDKKAQSFSSFHVERSDAVASRGFADAVMAKDSVFGKYPTDFELVSVCDVHDCYADSSFETHVTVGMVDHRVVVTAEQVLAMRSVGDPAQLQLIKEA